MKRILQSQLSECKNFTRDLQEKYLILQQTLEKQNNFISQQKEIFSFKLNAVESKYQTLRKINFTLEVLLFSILNFLFIQFLIIIFLFMNYLFFYYLLIIRFCIVKY